MWKRRMQMKKQIVTVLAATLALSMVGCGGSSSSSAGTESASSTAETAAASSAASSSAAEETTEAAGDTAVGVILKTSSSEYWGYVTAGCEAAAADLGVTVDIVGPPSETSYDEQNSEIENYVSSGKYDALVIAPLQPDSIETVLGDPGMPVIFVDTDADYSLKTQYVGTGNEQAAYEAGKFALENAAEKENVVIIAGVQGNTTSEQRQAGFEKALSEAGIEPKAIQNADWVTDKATEKMENIITTLNNDVDIVLCGNDDMASGVSKALKQAGIEDCYIMGFDGIQSGIENIVAGDVSATAAQSPYQMGYQSIENAVKAAQGETIDEVVDTGCEIITADNADEYLTTLKEMLGE